MQHKPTNSIPSPRSNRVIFLIIINLGLIQDFQKEGVANCLDKFNWQDNSRKNKIYYFHRGEGGAMPINPPLNLHPLTTLCTNISVKVSFYITCNMIQSCYLQFCLQKKSNFHSLVPSDGHSVNCLVGQLVDHSFVCLLCAVC